MNVHVDIGRVYFEIEKIGHLLTYGYQLFESLHHCFVEIRMTHITSVHEKVLMGSFLTGRIRFTHETGQTNQRSLYIDSQKLLVEFLTENIDDTLAQCGFWQTEHDTAVLCQRESYVFMH